MKPNLKLAETTTPDGARLILYEHDKNYCLRLNGQDLMHSAVTASEIRIGEMAAGHLSNRPNALGLLGGLGLGFTLRGVLKNAPPKAKVQVAELMPEIVEWNRKLLRNLNGKLLDDSRVEVLLEDVWTLLSKSPPATFDVLVLDVDNGPTAMVQKKNSRLYTFRGLALLAEVLKPGGRALFWSARPDPAFEARLGRVGFKTRVLQAPLYHGAKRDAVSIYLADK